MLAPVLTLVLTLGLAVAVSLPLRAAFRAHTVGWRLLAVSGWPLAAAGAVFVLRFWDPTPGPYLANVRYPFGTQLNAWAVSFGFSWIAFGLLFSALALLAPPVASARSAARRAWGTLAAAWLICWLPHGLIGLAVAWGGLDAGSTAAYRDWAAEPVGALTLALDAALLVSHAGCSLAGFVLTARDVRRAAVAPGAPPGAA